MLSERTLSAEGPLMQFSQNLSIHTQNDWNQKHLEISEVGRDLNPSPSPVSDSNQTKTWHYPVLGDLSKFEVSTRWKVPASTHMSIIIQGKILYIYLIKNVHRGLYQPTTELEEIYILSIIFNCSSRHVFSFVKRNSCGTSDTTHSNYC